MRDRLIELINDCRSMDGYGMDLVEKQADHLLANGVIVPPVSIGNTVYELIVPRYGKSHHINKATVMGFRLGDFRDLCGHKRKEYLCVLYDTSPYITHITLDKIGKTVFLTKEEAEQALKEREQNEKGLHELQAR